jgi:putative redox protein
MTTDVAYILSKGRYPLRALRSHMVADRAPEDPHRFTRITLHMTVDGDVPGEAVDRAIALSREKYCSVWHSMRQDIEFTAIGEVRDPAS